MAFMTVEDGQEGLLFTNRGQGRLVIGPRRVSIRFKLIHFLPHFTNNGILCCLTSHVITKATGFHDT